MRHFIEDRINVIKKTYIEDPNRIISDYNKEVREIEGYKGRQLLELVQNADDELITNKGKEVYIRLYNGILQVANNGQPFTEKGVVSLMYSNLSPKAKLFNKIGNKGTGFRSILSWAKSVNIKSYDLSIGFSYSYAEMMLEELIKDNKNIAEYFTENAFDKGSIATLVAPYWLEKQKDLPDYDTVITIEILPEILDEIEKQIQEIDMELLLFLNNVEIIKIESEKRNETLAKTKHEDGSISVGIYDINGNKKTKRTWNIKKEKGQFTNKNYEIAIAYTENLSDNKNVLYSYFKTDISFPFPAIIHGTFNLNADRNHLLKDNEENKFMINRLSDLLIETALEITSNEEVDYGALSLLCFDGDIAPEISEMEFEKNLLDKIKKSKLFPTTGSEYVNFYRNPKFYNEPFSDILNQKEFNNLLLYTEKEQIKNLIYKLSGKKTLQYDYKEFVKKISIVSKQFTLNQRVKCISMILKAYSYELQTKNQITPDLLLNSEGNIVKSDEITFINPVKSEALEAPPEYAKIKFLNSDMFNSLLSELKITNYRDLAARLQVFGVREYAYEAVANRLLNKFNKRFKDGNKALRKDLKETIRWFFGAYKKIERIRDKKQEDLQLFNRQGEIMPAAGLYIGKEYGNNINEDLLSNIRPYSFAADMPSLGLDEYDQGEVIEFLKWIGVSVFPKMQLKELHRDEKTRYIDFIKKNLNFPLKIEDCFYNTVDDFNVGIKSVGEIYITQIDELNDILENVSTKAILEWFGNDKELGIVLDSLYENNKYARIGMKLDYKDRLRYLSGDRIPSFIAWKIRNANWVTVKNNIRVSPPVCCLARNIGTDFSPFLEQPDLEQYVHGINGKHKREKRIQFENSLIKSGVSKDFSELGADTVYSVLLKLPEGDPEGAKARSFYRQLIQNVEIDQWDYNNSSYNRFKEIGKVFANKNGVKMYLPVNDVFYLDDKTVCKDVIISFPLLDLEKRKGKEKVEKILGVKPFANIKLKLQEDPKMHPLNMEFKEDFKSFIVYAYCYRYEKDTNFNELSKFRKLDVNICTDIETTFSFDGSEKKTSLAEYEYIETEKNKVYLKIPKNRHFSREDFRNDFKFCESISEILSTMIDVEGNRKDFRDLFSKKDSDRRLTIKSDFDGFDIIAEIRHKFKQEFDEKTSFWQSVIRMKHPNWEYNGQDDLKDIIIVLMGNTPEELSEIYFRIDYENINKIENAPYIIELFSQTFINIKEYNEISEVQVDITQFLKNSFEKVKKEFQGKYQTYIYGSLIDKTIIEKGKFRDIVNLYDSLSVKVENDINTDVKKDLFNCINVNLEDIVEKDLNSIYFANRLNLVNLLQLSEETVQEFTVNAQYDSLIYFGEIDELKRLYDKHNEKEKGYQEILNGCSPDNAKKDIEEFKYEIISIPETQSSDIATQPVEIHNTGGHGKGYPKSKNNEKIGLIGERYVYTILSQKYDKVEWVSENAKIEKVNSNGEAGCGYDMWYINEQEEKLYVEVKATIGTEEGFYISAHELEVAEKYKDNYEIILVTRVNDKERQFFSYKGLFNYREDETRYNNNKFKLDAREYRILTKRKSIM